MPRTNTAKPIRVHTNGAAEEGKCTYRLPGCDAEEHGAVTPYLLADGDIQVHICDSCFGRLTTSRQWIKSSGASAQ
jgi:hypothetical protein